MGMVTAGRVRWVGGHGGGGEEREEVVYISSELVAMADR
jgi:hypothetical protein